MEKKKKIVFIKLLKYFFHTTTLFLDLMFEAFNSFVKNFVINKFNPERK